jgi:hypothetical protein
MCAGIFFFFNFYFHKCQLEVGCSISHNYWLTAIAQYIPQMEIGGNKNEH